MDGLGNCGQAKPIHTTGTEQQSQGWHEWLTVVQHRWRQRDREIERGGREGEETEGWIERDRDRDRERQREGERERQRNG